MSDVASDLSPCLKKMSALAGQIGWVWRTARWVAIAQAGVALWGILRVYALRAPREIVSLAPFAAEIEGASAGRWNLFHEIFLALWLFVRLARACVWRVFSIYGAGLAFSLQGASPLRRVGSAVCALILAVLALDAGIFGNLSVHHWLLPPDLLYLSICGSLVAFSGILAQASERGEGAHTGAETTR